MLVATIRHGLPHTGAGRAGRYTHREVGMQRVEWTPTEELERRVGVGPFRQAWTGSASSGETPTNGGAEWTPTMWFAVALEKGGSGPR